MEEEILDNPLQKEDEVLRTKSIKGLEIGLFVAIVFIIVAFVNATMLKAGNPEDIKSLLITTLICVCPSVYGYWFRINSLKFEENPNKTNFDFPVVMNILRIVSVIVGTLFLIMAVVMPYLVLRNPVGLGVKPFYGLAAFYFVFSGTLGILYFFHPILTKRRVDFVLEKINLKA